MNFWKVSLVKNSWSSFTILFRDNMIDSWIARGWGLKAAVEGGTQVLPLSGHSPAKSCLSMELGVLFCSCRDHSAWYVHDSPAPSHPLNTFGAQSLKPHRSEEHHGAFFEGLFQLPWTPSCLCRYGVSISVERQSSGSSVRSRSWPCSNYLVLRRVPVFYSATFLPFKKRKAKERNTVRKRKRSNIREARKSPMEDKNITSSDRRLRE